MKYLTFCEDPAVLSTISFVKTIIDFITIIVPVILILLMAIEIAKIVINPDEKLTRQVFKSITNKMLATATIYFIPIIVSLLMSMIQVDYQKNSCWLNSTDDGIASAKIKAEAYNEANYKSIFTEKENAKIERERIAKEREKARLEAEKKAKSSDASFGVRTVPPTPNDYYYTYYRGLVSQCPWYAIARAMEIVSGSNLSEADKERKLAYLYDTHGNGKEIFGIIKNRGTFPVGQEPRAPAILTYGGSLTKYGHVAILEKIENGVATITDSRNKNGPDATDGWHAVDWRTRTMSISEMENWMYIFQGYVYILE